MNLEEIAKKIREAGKTLTAIDPIRTEFGTEDLETAYRIQQINIRERVSNGCRIVGKKIGLTSFAVQEQLGVDQPDFGILMNDMEIMTGHTLSADALLQPKAETEIAFVLKHDLRMEQINSVDLLNAIDYALPAIEIVDSRISNWDIKITDTIADNASASHFVLGHSPTSIADFDMTTVEMRMSKNGELVSSGNGAACMGSPLNAMLWLANKMREMDTPLLAGEVILTGALGPMVPVTNSDHITATIDGLGSVEVYF